MVNSQKCENVTVTDCPKINLLKGSHKRMAEVLMIEIQELAKRYGVEKLGMLTVTFADDSTAFNHDEAERHFNSLATNVLKDRYERVVVAKDRAPKTGRIHFHLIVVCHGDIRTGVNHKQIERGVYHSAPVALRAEWSYLREHLEKYGFGKIHHLTPIKSTIEAASRYVAKYITKGVSTRTNDDKGRRFSRFLGFHCGERKAFARFAWNTLNGKLWRLKAAEMCRQYGCCMEDLEELLGPRWCFYLQDAIMSMPVELIDHGAAELNGMSIEVRMLSLNLPGQDEFKQSFGTFLRAMAQENRLKAFKVVPQEVPF